jgi:uncharacterized membrane protein YhhN
LTPFIQQRNWLPGQRGGGMKRYLVFAALVPLLGGFWLLLTSTLMSRYWIPPTFAEAAKLLAEFALTIQYSYLFGIVPALMIGAVDDILFHVKRMGPVTRMLVVGAIAFIAAELLYGSRGSDSGAIQFMLYGLVGFIPATISSWLSREVGSPVAA